MKFNDLKDLSSLNLTVDDVINTIPEKNGKTSYDFEIDTLKKSINSTQPLRYTDSLNIKESDISKKEPLKNKNIEDDLRRFTDINYSSRIWEISYNGGLYYGGINNLSMYNEDFNIPYEYHYTIIPILEFHKFLKEEKSKIEFHWKVSNKISELQRHNFKEQPPLSISTKKSKSDFLMHYCFYFKNNPNIEILNYLGVHPNNVNNISKRLWNKTLSFDVVNKMAKYITENYL